MKKYKSRTNKPSKNQDKQVLKLIKMILNKYLTTYQGLKIHVVIPESLTYFE